MIFALGRWAIEPRRGSIAAQFGGREAAQSALLSIQPDSVMESD